MDIKHLFPFCIVCKKGHFRKKKMHKGQMKFLGIIFGKKVLKSKILDAKTAVKFKSNITTLVKVDK